MINKEILYLNCKAKKIYENCYLYMTCYIYNIINYSWYQSFFFVKKNQTSFSLYNNKHFIKVKQAICHHL